MASAMSNTVPSGSSFPNDPKANDPLTKELWNICAHSTAGVPKEAQLVYYFLQGHMEQLQETMKLEHDRQIPQFETPCKILCRVMNVERMIEDDTEEVYAHITLQATEQIELTDPVSDPPEKPKPTVHTFTKILTASDIGTHGSFSLHRKHATDCLPLLDLNQAAPSQELVTKDFHGHEWRFKHIFRGEPRRNLLTRGWNKFVNSKNLVAGDEFVFIRGDNGEMKVGVRRISRKKPSAPILSAQSLSLAVVATGRHAISELSIFSIYYKTRASPFLIGVTKYQEAMNYGFHVGMPIKTNNDGEHLGYIGKIVEVGDFSPQWPGSQWRSLKVQWYEQSRTERLPDRVSPWEVEPYVAFPYQGVPPTRNKRTRSPPGSDVASSSGVAEVQHGSELGGSIRKPSLPHPNTSFTNFRLFGVDLTSSIGNVAGAPATRTRTEVNTEYPLPVQKLLFMPRGSFQ